MEETSHLWRGQSQNKYVGQNFYVHSEKLEPEMQAELDAINNEVNAAVEKMGKIDLLKQE